MGNIDAFNYIAEGTHPRPDSLALIKECSTAFVPDAAHLAEWHRSFSDSHDLVRMAHDIDILRDYVPRSAHILEVGSVPLIVTRAIAKVGYKVSGCDIAPERYASAISEIGLNVLKCNVETELLPFADGTFDAVIFNEIFEHLRINPIFTLAEVRRVLKPGGTLQLSSPNLRSLGGLLNFLIRNLSSSCCGDIYTEYQKLERLGHMGHVREYTTSEVVSFLEKVGFKIDHIIFRGRYRGSARRVITKIIPSLRPFVSYVGHKV